MKKKISLFAVLILLLAVITGCGTEKTVSEGDEKESGGNDKKRFAIIYKNTGNPYGEKQMEGYKNAIEELGHEAILRAPDQPTAEAQIQIIEELIAQNVDVIAVVANDPDALEPALKRAMDRGIKVISLDSGVNAASRMVHINQADPERIGRIQIEAISEMINGEGQIAVLSATSQATNQNIWIEWMKEELKDAKYKDIELVSVVYGDDLRDKSVSETEALLLAYPNLKGIISPTTVGIAAAGRVLKDKGLDGKVQLTGLGLPSEMADYIESGVSQWMYLWNPIDVGYLAGYAANALVEGEITGEAGGTFNAGKLGTKEIVEDGDGSQIMLGDPFQFDKDNISEWKEVY